MTNFEIVVQEVIARLRDLTPRQVVELGVLHGFCVDAARDDHPNLVSFLSSANGLEAFSAQLFRMPNLIEAVEVDGSKWRFVESPSTGNSVS